MTIAYNEFLKRCNQNSDINQLLPIIYSYACKCRNIAEFGVRSGNSTWALLASNPESLISCDIDNLDINEYIAAAEEINCKYSFHCGSDLDESFKIDQVDMLFIDTDHQYNQLIRELIKHESYVGDYILIHDTTTYGFIDMPDGMKKDKWVSRYNYNWIDKSGLFIAILDFINLNINWAIDRFFDFNNGLTILKRL